MARTTNNIFTQGISGMIGGQMVFKNWNDKTYVFKSSKKPTKQSPIQKENRTKFRRATAFAKKMMADPVKKTEYQEIAKNLQLPNAYTAAVTEYMRKPEILDVEINLEPAKEASEIKVIARKKGFELEEVEIIVLDEKGITNVKEKATKGPANIWKWSGKAEGDFDFIVKVKDAAGNVIEKRYKRRL